MQPFLGSVPSMPHELAGLHRAEELLPQHASVLCPHPHVPVPRKRNPVWVGNMIMPVPDVPGTTGDHGLRDVDWVFRDRAITTSDVVVE
jgi:hypothetical protein